MIIRTDANMFDSCPFQIYDMLGNAWEWMDGGEPAARILRGGSFVDYDPNAPPESKASAGKRWNPARPPTPANHAITPGTRMVTTQDSGSANTSFRCASTLAIEAEARQGTRGGGGGAGRDGVVSGEEEL